MVVGARATRPVHAFVVGLIVEGRGGGVLEVVDDLGHFGRSNGNAAARGFSRGSRFAVGMKSVVSAAPVMVRSESLVLSSDMARSCTLVLSREMARSEPVVLSRLVARSSMLVLSRTMARSDTLVLSPAMAKPRWLDHVGVPAVFDHVGLRRR